MLPRPFSQPSLGGEGGGAHLSFLDVNGDGSNLHRRRGRRHSPVIPGGRCRWWFAKMSVYFVFLCSLSWSKFWYFFLQLHPFLLLIFGRVCQILNVLGRQLLRFWVGHEPIGCCIRHISFSTGILVTLRNLEF